MRAKICMIAMNEERLRGKSQEEMRDIALERIDGAASLRPDLVCLPEIFLKTGGDRENPRWREISADTVERLRARARAMGCYIACTVYEPVADKPLWRQNTALLIGRSGEIVGKYQKAHTVDSETLVTRVLPGGEPPVFDTDFGRVGMLICFDIGWRAEWARMAEKGAKLVLWMAAYDGGSMLNMYAQYHAYFVASSVRTSHAKIVDPTGAAVAESSRWDGLAAAEIDTDATLFHIDRQYPKLDAVRGALGPKVDIRSCGEENVFLLSSRDDEWPVARVAREFGLIPYRDYHAEADAIREDALSGRLDAFL